VQSFLVSQGVGSDRMRTISYGKERPIEVCSTEACYSKNRRAVTVLSVGAGA
jgi:peptidoglycan-associated lipoprotein